MGVFQMTAPIYVHLEQTAMWHPKISRVWAMPNSDTFSVQPIGDFVRGWALDCISVDPFARDSCIATYTNDLNPNTRAQYHMDAEDFLKQLAEDGVVADCVILDPPYSPRQISECYKAAGRSVGMKETQNAALYARVRKAVLPICAKGTHVLSFGWNSVGMGKMLGFKQEEILLVCHGGAHNDTICLAETKL
jgi:hypothetical protein